MNSRDLKTSKYVKISKSNFFAITILSLHSICSESKKGKLTRLTLQVNSLKGQENNSISIVEVYESDVNSLYNKINNLNNNILKACRDSECDKYENEMHELFSKAVVLENHFKRLVKKTS